MANGAKYLEVAEGLGARLCREAIWSDDRCTWTGDSIELIESRLQVVNCACGPELYNGTSGIALFLTYLFACTQQNIFKETALGAISFALSQLDQLDPAHRFGFHTGLTGIAYVLAEAGEILDEEQAIGHALELLKIVSAREPAWAHPVDVMSGSAGVIPVLLNLHERYGEQFLLDAALRLGDCLLQAANRGQEEEQGWSWTTVPDTGMKDLTGFSHGVAGIAWALAELYNKFKERRFLQGAEQALRYERHWFDPQQENWPDFRVTSETGEPDYAVAWCHGAPGIGLSRLRCYQILQDRECLAEAQVAIRTTAKVLNVAISSGQGNYSLCHGNCGNAELLISAADLLADDDSLKIIQQLADNAREKYHLTANPWPCGVLNGGETPNLMLGLAGIGYFYLRLCDPEVPPVLLVAPESS